ncbi:hypothetical protein GCM10010171_55300 [Actinokineospora fastidiosa]|uniref:Uncharacterized protein n=1 Tax=Actinokineospora fastidiosa TaxID=1816 RepID=A0A918GQK4_9PSEU|nr:hypothetical protein GCM10010171_55300 [Actinokineospora fastidiosa]
MDNSTPVGDSRSWTKQVAEKTRKGYRTTTDGVTQQQPQPGAQKAGAPRPSALPPSPPSLGRHRRPTAWVDASIRLLTAAELR